MGRAGEAEQHFQRAVLLAPNCPTSAGDLRGSRRLVCRRSRVCNRTRLRRLPAGKSLCLGIASDALAQCIPEHGLQQVHPLKPDFQLARNNLQWAESEKTDRTLALIL
jgi:hypothetical protein